MEQEVKRDLTCTYCGKKRLSKTGRKKHNKICSKNPNYSKPSRSNQMDAFECMAEGLPDGAYWAMAEEFGLDASDFID